MTFRNKFQTRVAARWTIALLAVVLTAIGALAVLRIQRVQAKDDAQSPTLSIDQQNLNKIETILREDGKEARVRVEEALRAIEDAKKQNNQTSALSPVNLFAAPWLSFSSPLGGNEWTVSQELNRMRSNMDRLFDNAFSRMKFHAASSPTTNTLTWSPQGEFEEKKDAYVYRFDLPGVQKTEVNITLKNGQLIVEDRRESRVEQTDTDRGLYRREIQHGQFRRVTALPANVDVNGAIESKLENGVLTVELPKLRNVDKNLSPKIEINK